MTPEKPTTAKDAKKKRKWFQYRVMGIARQALNPDSRDDD
jgi:hypothetical protein